MKLPRSLTSAVYLVSEQPLQGSASCCPAEFTIRQHDPGPLPTWDRDSILCFDSTRTNRMNLGLDVIGSLNLDPFFARPRLARCRFSQKLARTGSVAVRQLGSTFHVASTILPLAPGRVDSWKRAWMQNCEEW